MLPCAVGRLAHVSAGRTGPVDKHVKGLSGRFREERRLMPAGGLGRVEAPAEPRGGNRSGNEISIVGNGGPE